MEKTLRYLLMTIAILGVLSVNAQTHQYSATHEQAAFTSVQVNPQMPSATMDWHSDYMTTGSHLPQAAVEGPTTTYGEQAGPHKGNARRATLEDDDWEDDDDPDIPGEPFPIGGAAIPLALLALAYLIMRVVRKRSV